jgi:DNA-binding beta-propeller fold protein YncE
MGVKFQVIRAPPPGDPPLCYDAVLGSLLHLNRGLPYGDANRHHPPSRRAFLATAGIVAGSAFSACSQQRAKRYRAWLFMASAAEKAIDIADLAEFKHSGSIPLGGVPNQVLSARGKLYVVCSAERTIVRINPFNRRITGRIAAGGTIAGAVVTSDGAFLALALSQPSAIVLIDTATDAITHRVPLPHPAQSIAGSAKQVAALLDSGDIARVSVPEGALLGITSSGGASPTAIDYRKDGGTLFVASPETREIVSFDATSGAMLARLPVPIRPARFCTDGTGGQVFITGADLDARLVIFSPYQNQIDETFYAGHSLFGMAVAPVWNLLFLSNPDAGDVTIVNIETRKIVSSVSMGGKPREILIAASPDGKTPEEYAFVVDSETGDVSVIHIPVVLHKSGDAFISEPPKPVFAVIRSGARPQSAVIIPYPE